MNKLEHSEQFYYKSERPEIMFEAGEGSPLVIFNGATHGNEYQPVAAVEEFLQRFNPVNLIKGRVRFIMANPVALRAGKRFIHEDLNRAYPGNILAQGESKVAAQMLELVYNADYVIDLHTAPDPPPFVVLGARNQARLQLAELAPIRSIVLFEATTPCAMVDFTTCGIGIELGGHDNEGSVVKGVNIISRYMSGLGFTDDNNFAMGEHEYYEIYNGLTTEQIPEQFLGNLRNFQPVRNSELGLHLNEEFSFPVLCGVKDYSPIYCYLARRVERERLV